MTDNLAAELDAVDTTRAELLQARRQRDQAQTALTRAIADNDELRRILDIVDTAESGALDPPKWMAPAPPRAAKRATLVLLLSDCHFDEVVRPEEVGDLNAYNREIAMSRLHEWGANAVKLARHYLAGVTYDGVLLMLGGDLLSGDIHEELTETNEDTMLGSLFHWSEQIAGAVGMLADEFGKVHVTAVPGNHGRTSRKPRAKLRARSNFDWLLAKQVERHYVKDKRITFAIGDDADSRVEVYGRGQLLTHGDQVTGGSGIGGIWPPIMRLRARKAQRAMSIGKPFEVLWMGHWHQLIQTPSLIINGSLKGTDEYAWLNNFGHEPAQQALAVITPEHGITFQCPVFAEKPASP